MSNLTLKEQLEALSLGSAPKSSQKEPKNFKERGKLTAIPKPKPAWLEHAQYGVELLKAYFPDCFRDTKEIQPLKIGIKQDLVKHLSMRDDIVLGDKACMVSSLSYYVSSSAYHKNVVQGVARIDLNGQATGAVSALEAQYSSEWLKSKTHKKDKKRNDDKL